VVAEVAQHAVQPRRVQLGLVDEEQHEQTGQRLVVQQLATAQAQAGAAGAARTAGASAGAAGRSGHRPRRPAAPVAAVVHGVDPVPAVNRESNRNLDFRGGLRKWLWTTSGPGTWVLFPGTWISFRTLYLTKFYWVLHRPQHVLSPKSNKINRLQIKGLIQIYLISKLYPITPELTSSYVGAV